MKERFLYFVLISIPFHVSLRLLQCALLHVSNHATLSDRLDGATLRALSRVLHLFVTAWQEQMQRRKDKEDKEESLFWYKTRTHGDERSPEEREEEELRDFFPTFDQVKWPPGACEKVASDFRSGGGFRQVLWFPSPLTTG